MTGLLAAAPIKWLISSEPDVRRAVEAFILGQGEPTSAVAGPPDADDLAHARRFGHATALPCVTLRMRMVNDHISGVPHVEVTASDIETDEIEAWRHRAARRARQRLQNHLMTQTAISPPPSN